MAPDVKISKIIHGDCIEVMKDMEADSIDSIVTDPPYGLSFMGKDWDHGVPGIRFWKAALRVTKPGAHLLAFGGTRTFHRLAVAIEDAGWVIRDTIGWIYGSGFPKSHNVGKAIDKAAGVEREIIGDKFDRPGYHLSGHDGGEAFGHGLSSSTPETRLKSAQITVPATEAAKQWDGWGTALKPAWEPVIVARKSFEETVASNVVEHGTGALNIAGCRVEGKLEGDPNRFTKAYSMGDGHEGWKRPSHETNTPPVVRAEGRWPANIIHDGSDEVLEVFPNSKSCNSPSNAKPESKYRPQQSSYMPQGKIYPGDKGSAARFFYCAKASKKERNAGLEGMELQEAPKQGGAPIGRKTSIAKRGGNIQMQNNHPTVKPIALMRYLCRLVTPPNGIVFDPFMGSGSTGVAAIQEGFEFIGCDIEAEYVEIAKRRISAAKAEGIQLKLMEL